MYTNKLFYPTTPHMKLSQEIIDWLIERQNRHRNAEKLYCFIWVHWWQQLRTAFDWFLQQLVLSWAFTELWKHYKLSDVNILYNFKKRSAI